MQAYIAYLKSNFENINIIFIDFMDLAYEEIKEPKRDRQAYKGLRNDCYKEVGTEIYSPGMHEIADGRDSILISKGMYQIIFIYM